MDNVAKITPFANLETNLVKYIHSDEKMNKIKTAYDYALEKHDGQVRKSGEPYVNHVIAVANILSELQVEPVVIIAGLLHDVVEDCDVSVDEIERLFTKEVAILVDAVTKLGNLPKASLDDYQAENHRKIFIAMSKDIRVILVKLSDRLHNMRTLQFMKPEKQQKIAQETLDVYAPIAHRLGLGEIKAELEDRCLYYLDNKRYFEIAKLVELKKTERLNLVKTLSDQISDILTEHDINHKIYGRSKHLYSIYKKMVYRNKRFDEIYDLTAIRIICDTVSDCYAILGHIHTTYTPLPGRFKDYIAMKKPNLYQSLHTTVLGLNGTIFEVQIRTFEMDIIAEQGFAAHWRYKEGNERVNQKAIEEQLHWFRDFVSLSDEGNDIKAKEYMQNLQQDIFEANVYCLTPKGKVVHLTQGSCVIDFAYKVHTRLPETMSGAVVNGQFVPFSTKLKTGDVVEIKTQSNASGPTIGWLDLVKTNTAKKQIRAYLKAKEDELHREGIEKGEVVLNNALRKRKLDDKVIQNHVKIEPALKFFKANTIEDIYYEIYQKNINPNAFLDKVYNRPSFSLPNLLKKRQPTASKSNTSGVIVEGIDNMVVTLSNCCSPIPGDDIIGFISTGVGIKVHRRDCKNLKSIPAQKLINVYWDPNMSGSGEFKVELLIRCTDRSHLLVDIVTTLSQSHVKMESVNSSVVDIEAITTIVLIVNNGEQLSKIIANIKKIEGVITVERLSY